MTEFAIAMTALEATGAIVPRARTQEDAARRAGGPVQLVMESLAATFPSPQEAMAAVSDFYASGAELVFQDGGWRVFLRFWRPVAPRPVATSAKEALRKPLGRAHTQAEAEAILGVPAEAVSETLPWRYRSRRRMLARFAAQLEVGVATVVQRGDFTALQLAYWRPRLQDPARPMQHAERVALAARMAAPLRSMTPQSPLDIGLFESRAPENPDVVLAEEGDGRRPQE